MSNFPQATFQDIDVQGALAHAVATWIKRLPAKDRQRCTVSAARGHAGIHCRLPVKLLSFMRKDLMGSKETIHGWPVVPARRPTR